MSKLLNNLPVEDLTSENDYLGIIDKGEIIKAFLESNTDEFKEIKMFSLYGEWGSGKSTLMKYLQKELKSSFNTYFFESWEFESDSNLSLSLLEFLISKSQDSTEEASKEILRTGYKLFKGLTKSVKVSFPLGLVSINADGSKIVESLEDKSEDSFLQLKNNFKTEFRRWEDAKTKSKKHNFNIVFIDDLDRCEPENVLNLLSALKLFFTYGTKTIFFCGIDKKAVNEAVKTKYGKVVKANEYLEKIFDISFTMPEHDDLLKLVSQYFDDREVESIEGKLNKNISEFLKALKFTNPRRVKKILNKYQILRNLKLNNIYENLIPDIIVKKTGNFFETIFTLYFLIAYDFRKEIFNDFFNLELKKAIYLDLVQNPSNNRLVFDVNKNFLNAPFDRIIHNLNTSRNNLNHNTKIDLIRAFSPMRPKYIGGSGAFLKADAYISQFLVDKKDIDYYFSLYLIDNIED